MIEGRANYFFTREQVPMELDLLRNNDPTVRAYTDLFVSHAGRMPLQDVLVQLVVALAGEKGAYFKHCLQMEVLRPPPVLFTSDGPVLAERERCAQLAERYAAKHDDIRRAALEVLAEHIRAQAIP